MAYKSWKTKVDNQHYEIVYSSRYWPDYSILRVNDDVYEIPSYNYFAGLDMPFNVGGREAHFVMVKGQATDVAVDGTYLGSGQKYVPLEKFPNWGWLFVAFWTFLLFNGGMLGGVLAIVAFFYSLRIILPPSIPFKSKINRCILLTVVTYAGYFFLLALNIMMG